MTMKKLTPLLLVGVLSLSVALSGCKDKKEGGNNTDSPTAAPSTEEENDDSAGFESYVVEGPYEEAAVDTASDERIAMLIQDHTNGNIAEIPYIVYKGSHSGIDELNEAIENSLVRMYNDCTDDGDLVHNVEIKAYTLTSERYLQFVVTSCILPVSLPNGNIDSFNYDIENKKVITWEDKAESIGLTADDFIEKTNSLLASYDPEAKIADISVTGFLIKETPQGETVTFLLELVVFKGDTNIGKSFYGLTPDTDTLFKIDTADLKANFEN